jgi:hypothetical protein
MSTSILIYLEAFKSKLENIKLKVTMASDDSYVKLRVWNDEQDYKTGLIDNHEYTLYEFLHQLMGKGND